MSFKEQFYSFLYFDNLDNFLSESQLLLENSGLTVNDLLKKYPSNLNKKHYKIRQKEGHTGSYLKDVIYNSKKDSITLEYEVIPTFEEDVKTVTDSGKIIEDTKYKVMIEFEEVDLSPIEEFFKLSKMNQVEKIRDIIKTKTIKIHSNSMAWLFQGTWENYDKIDASIYPFPKNNIKGKGIWNKRHSNSLVSFHITKHLMESLSTPLFLVNTIAKILREKYE